MEQQQNKPIKEEKEKSSREKVYLVIIILLLLACGTLTWQLVQKTSQIEYVLIEKGELETERDNLVADLEALQTSYDTLSTDNEELKLKIQEQQAKIEEYLVQIEKHKDDAYIIRKLREETKSLRKIMQGYVHTIDSLNTLNQNLTAELVDVKEDRENLQKDKENLTNIKEDLEDMVEVGSILQALNIKANAIKVKSSGKQVDTERASRADMIKVCFTIGENKIAKSGNKPVYLRIITPDAKVLNEDEGNRFNFNGVKGLYSIKKEVNYQNQTINNLCVYFDLNEAEIPTGKYIVEIYADEAKIGDGTFNLK